MLTLPNKEISFWKHDSLDAIYPSLEYDITADVVIVGAGITGLTAAYLLKQSGLMVVVLEKSTIGGGTTGRTTGKVTAQHNLVYYDMHRRFGERTARTYGQANQAALERISTIIAHENIICDWQRDDNYVYTANPGQIEQCKIEAKIATYLGLPATFETETPLPFAVAGAVKFANQAKLHSVKYLYGLARAINGQGSHVLEHSQVVGIRDGNPAIIRTRKAKITAGAIVVATNVPTFPLMARGGYCAFEYPTESYIVAGRISSERSGMYISPDKENYSILPITVDNEQWILVGGESHISGLRNNKQFRYQRLARYAEERLGVATIEYKWSDRDYLAYDSIPLVGKIYPWSKHLYTATGFMKWGLTNGTVAAMILHDLVQDRPNPWAQVFATNRTSPIAAIPSIFTGK